MASGKFRALKINLAIGFIPKTHWNALVRLYSSIFLKQGVNLTFEGDDSLLQLLLITSHNKLACT